MYRCCLLVLTVGFCRHAFLSTCLSSSRMMLEAWAKNPSGKLDHQIDIIFCQRFFWFNYTYNKVVILVKYHFTQSFELTFLNLRSGFHKLVNLCKTSVKLKFYLRPFPEYHRINDRSSSLNLSIPVTRFKTFCRNYVFF